MMEIIRGTTPTLQYTFKDVDVDDIQEAYLVLKQSDTVTIEKDISDSRTLNGCLYFKLTQQDTLLFMRGQNVTAVLDWKLFDGTRGRSSKAIFRVDDPGKNEVI